MGSYLHKKLCVYGENLATYCALQKESEERCLEIYETLSGDQLSQTLVSESEVCVSNAGASWWATLCAVGSVGFPQCGFQKILQKNHLNLQKVWEWEAKTERRNSIVPKVKLNELMGKPMPI